MPNAPKTQFQVMPLEQLIATARVVIAARLAGEPQAATLQPGIDLALGTLEIAGRQLGPSPTVFGADAEAVTAAVVAAWEANGNEEGRP